MQKLIKLINQEFANLDKYKFISCESPLNVVFSERNNNQIITILFNYNKYNVFKIKKTMFQ